MSIDERSRHELFVRLEQVLGPEPASTLMEHLLPVGWGDVATKRDLAVMRTDLSAEINLLRSDLSGEISLVRSDLSGEINVLRSEMVGMKHEILATMRGEFAGQTRAMFVAIVTIVLTMSGLVFALAR